ncbi:MAG: DEAD/DEAH box helicase [Flavobacteriales bacterium]|nr:DEAD/DEAH box helicase [Flavobacteriales bacterium]NCA19961.1 DEAD/DEAH box helicase [Crocinitomicaceae bacterium]
MKFKDYNLSQSIVSQLDVLGFKRPTDIQFRAIKHILDGEDVMAVAQTGTGKTAAFVIPMLNRLLVKPRGKYSGIRALILVPTRELCKQIAKVVDDIGANTHLKVLGLFGGVEQDQQIRELKSGLDVLVATPGRMFDLIAQGFVDISKLEMFVLDEADLMLDLGFNKDIKDVIRKIPKDRQTLFFTATINKKIKSLAYDVVKDAIRIQVSPQNPVSKNVNHAVCLVEMDDKRFFLENLLKEYPDYKFIVFVRTKVRAERVVAAMERVDVKSEALHGGIEQQERFAILDRFRRGENKVLITTDVACRGIDIPNMEYVVNYDLPDNPENYVHRCGRTGRGNATGQAMSFCSKEEEPLLIEIEAYTGEEVERYDISESEYQAILSDTDSDLFKNGDYDWQKLMAKNDNPDAWD